MRGDLALMKALSHMSDLIERLGEGERQQIVSSLLLMLRVPAKVDGYSYLLWAVQIYLEDPGQGIIKELYPAVAGKFGSEREWKRVEKGIRSAIDQAWRDCDEETWKLFFPAPGDLWARPSNTEFISRLARLLEIWLVSRRRNVG